MKEDAEGKALDEVAQKRKLQNHFILRFVLMDLDKCKTYLSLLEKITDNQIAFPIIEALIIAYAKPFTECQVTEGTKQVLIKRKKIPGLYRKIHNEIMDYRRKIIAHTDIYYRQPELISLPTRDNQKMVVMFFKGHYIEQWRHMLSEFSLLVDILIQEHEKMLFEKFETNIDHLVDRKKRAL